VSCFRPCDIKFPDKNNGIVVYQKNSGLSAFSIQSHEKFIKAEIEFHDGSFFQDPNGLLSMDHTNKKGIFLIHEPYNLVD